MTYPKPSYRIGNRIRLSDNALENEGYMEFLRKKGFKTDHIFTVAQWYDHYGKEGPHSHPGFDECAGTCIYDIAELPFSLYEWEMEKA